MIKFILSLALLLLLAFPVAVPHVAADNHPGVALTSGTSGNIDGTGKTRTAITASMTIAANQLALLWVGTTVGVDGPPTITDPSRTWAMVLTDGPNTKNRRLTLFKSISPVQTTGAATLRNPNRNTTWAWTAVEYPATEIVQVIYADALQYFQNSGRVVLPSATGNGGFTVATFAMHYEARPLYPGAGYQFTGGQPCVRMCLQAEGRADYAQEATMTWAGLCLNLEGHICHSMGIAVELR